MINDGHDCNSLLFALGLPFALIRPKTFPAARLCFLPGEDDLEFYGMGLGTCGGQQCRSRAIYRYNL